MTDFNCRIETKSVNIVAKAVRTQAELFIKDTCILALAGKSNIFTANINELTDYLQVDVEQVIIDSEVVIHVLSGSKWNVDRTSATWDIGRGALNITCEENLIKLKADSINYYDVHRKTSFVVFNETLSVTVTAIQLGTDILYLTDSEGFVLQDIDGNYIQSKEQ